MNQRWGCRANRGDEGVSLVLALVFILLVGLFSTVALTKSQGTLTSGQVLRERGQLQYGLDGGVDRAIQVMRSEMANADPSTCAQAAAATGSGSLTLNATTTSWSCTLLAGRAKKSSDGASTDYTVVVTGTGTDALTNKSGQGVTVSGSMFLNNPDTEGGLKKTITVLGGDVVSPSSNSNCEATLSSVTNLPVDTDRLKTCTEQTVSAALPTVSLGTAPAAAVAPTASLYPSGKDIASCRVFYPGYYSTAPRVQNDGNYFRSGLYYFNGIGKFDMSGNQMSITGGQRSVGDSPALAGSCVAMTDVLADAAVTSVDRTYFNPFKYSNGVSWVLGGTSWLSPSNVAISLYTPPLGSSSQPISIAAFSSATSGFSPVTSGPINILTNFSNNSQFIANGKIFAPSAAVDIFSTSSTVAAVRGGIVAQQLDLQASASGSSGVALQSGGGVGTPPPPFRTVSVVSSTSGNSAQNTAVFTISNFSPYTVKTKSWRTS